MGQAKKEYLRKCMEELDNDPFYQQMQDELDQHWWRAQDEELQRKAEEEHGKKS